LVRPWRRRLANVTKITIVSTAWNHGGASKITGDMAAIAAQVPALFEALSGMSMSELFSKVKTDRGQDAETCAGNCLGGDEPSTGKAKRRPSNALGVASTHIEPAGSGSAASQPALSRNYCGNGGRS